VIPQQPATLAGSRVILASLLAKLLLLALLFNRDPGIIQSPDTGTYERPALALLSSGTFAQSPQALSIPETNRTPGYPVLIAAVYLLFGRHPLLLALLNVLLATGTLVVLSILAQRLFGPRAAFLAVLLLALDPGSFHYAPVVLTDTPFTFLLLLGVLLLTPGEDQQRSQTFWAGLTLALATLFRPISYYLIPATAFFLVVRMWRKNASPGTWLRPVAAFLLAPVLLIGGWRLHNWQRTGSSAFSQSEAIELWMIRGLAVKARVDGVPVWEEQRREGWDEYLYRFGYVDSERAVFGDARYADLYARTARLSTTELAREYREKGSRMLRAHPGATLRMEVVGGVLLLFASPPLIWAYHYHLFRPEPEFEKAYFAPDYRAMFELLQRGHPVLLGLVLACIVALAIFYAVFVRGLLRARIRERWRQQIVPLGTLLYLFAVTSGPSAIDDRYRIPLMPLFCLYAGAGLARAIRAPSAPAVGSAPST
jgi:4-amino-4-deoxy-L-arabinose transferase-like glycosyltransferase